MLKLIFLILFSINPNNFTDSFSKNSPDLKKEVNLGIKYGKSLSKELARINEEINDLTKYSANSCRNKKKFSRIKSIKCPKDYKPYKNMYCFHVNQLRNTNYLQDFKYCQSKSRGFLVEENYAIAGIMLREDFKPGGRFMYIGLTDINHEMKGRYDDWRWVSTSKRFAKNKKELYYMTPDNFRGVEHFGIMDQSNLKLGDVDLHATYVHDTVCEWTPDRENSKKSKLSDWKPTRFGGNPRTGIFNGFYKSGVLNRVVPKRSLKHCYKSCVKTNKHCISFYYSSNKKQCVANFFVDSLLPREIKYQKGWVKYMQNQN